MKTLSLIVVGGGAAGMMAACAAAGTDPRCRVLLLEKNEKLGKKIYITGKGRCNFTNLCPAEDFFASVPCNSRFLYSSVYGFDSAQVFDWFESRGMKAKKERGNRAFPESDHASDVTKTLEREMRRLGVTVRLNTEVSEIVTEPLPEREREDRSARQDGGTGKRKTQSAGKRSRVSGVKLKDGTFLPADAVIVATGGLSYPSTGSTGDGYRFARSTGHSVGALHPSLVPLQTAEEDIPQMQGLSLKNVTLTVRDGKKKLCELFGEMMFTHFGVTGPLVLTASALIQRQIADHPLQAEIDLKPALTGQMLDARILRAFEASPNREIRNVLGEVYPAKMVPVMLRRCGIDPPTPVHDVTKQQRLELVEGTKHFRFTILSLRGWNEAVITHGGVSVKQIDPATMESKITAGLYFAGEVIDVDALTGGFNLQIAWSTGHAAGEGAAQAGTDALPQV